MEDMDIDSVVDIPDTPDRPAIQRVNGGNFVDEEGNLSVAGRVGGSNNTGEGSLDRLRGRGRLLSANGLNRKHYMHPRKLSDSTYEIERLKNTTVLSPVENVREHAPLFRKTAMERNKNSLREQDKEKGKAPSSKLPSKSYGFPEDHSILDLTEQKTYNHLPEMASLQNASENCLAEEGQAPRNGGFYAFNPSGFSETSRNSCKGKEKIDDVGLKSTGSVMSNGKGVGLSNGSPLRMEKQLPSSHHSIATPRAVGKRRLVRNGCISPQNIAIRAKQDEQSQSNFRPEQNFVNVGSSSPCMISEIVAEDNNNSVKGKRVAHLLSSKEYDINFINLSGSPMSNNGGASGIGDANRDVCFEERGGWRSTRNRSKNVDHAAEYQLSRFHTVGCQVSQQNENGTVKRNNASGGKTRILCDSPETCDATETAPVISRINQISEPAHANMLPKRRVKHVLTSRNNGESSRVTPNDPGIVFLGSSSESSRSRSSRIHMAEHSDVMDLDNSSKMRGINANHIDSMNDEDTEAKARQLEADEMLARELQEQLYHEIDVNIAWELQQEEDELLPTSFQTLQEPDLQVSTRRSRIQRSLRNIQNSSNRRGVQTHFPTSARVSRLRNRVLNQPRTAPSRTRDFQFPLDMDLDMRLDILEAMEAAVGDDDDMGMATRIFQVQRDFNENDYEMLLALDDNNHQHGGASVNQLNSLPLSKVQTDNYEACAVCLETPTIGETIRHLPCLHKFHKDCIDPWLRRKTSCPVCKSSIA